MMHRMSYWMRAKTQYGVHSPMVFEMYRKVLFARLSRERRAKVLALAGSLVATRRVPRRDRQYHELVFKLKDYYGLTTLFYNADEALLEGGEGCDFGSVKVVRRPHGSELRELRWRSQKQNPKYRVSIDLYDTGLLLDCHRLHPQEFLLR